MGMGTGMMGMPGMGMCHCGQNSGRSGKPVAAAVVSKVAIPAGVVVVVLLPQHV